MPVFPLSTVFVSVAVTNWVELTLCVTVVVPATVKVEIEVCVTVIVVDPAPPLGLFAAIHPVPLLEQVYLKLRQTQIERSGWKKLTQRCNILLRRLELDRMGTAWRIRTHNFVSLNATRSACGAARSIPCAWLVTGGRAGGLTSD